VVVTGFTEKRAFYLEESKLFRLFLCTMGFGLPGMLCVLAGTISGLYILVRMSQRATGAPV
jgi:hypothetical protein